MHKEGHQRNVKLTLGMLGCWLVCWFAVVLVCRCCLFPIWDVTFGCPVFWLLLSGLRVPCGLVVPWGCFPFAMDCPFWLFCCEKNKNKEIRINFWFVDAGVEIIPLFGNSSGMQEEECWRLGVWARHNISWPLLKLHLYTISSNESQPGQFITQYPPRTRKPLGTTTFWMTNLPR